MKRAGTTTRLKEALMNLIARYIKDLTTLTKKILDMKEEQWEATHAYLNCVALTQLSTRSWVHEGRT
jgi:hypothetical protein